MSAYFVTHPLMDKTAVVYAPSTEKARTTFLDWLERNGLMDRRKRQAFRRDMVAARLESPDIPADVELHYGYPEAPQVGYRLGGEQPTREDLEQQEVEEALGKTYEPSFEDYTAMEEMGHPVSPTPQPAIEEEPKPKRMPIQEVMLRGFG